MSIILYDEHQPIECQRQKLVCFNIWTFGNKKTHTHTHLRIY